MAFIIEAAACTLLPAVGGAIIAANSPSDIGVIVGGACIGAGIAGALGMLLSGVIEELDIPKLQGARRLVANWFCGLLCVPFISRIHRGWFPDEDLVMVAAGVAGLGALLGVVILMILIPKLINKGRKTADAWDGPNIKPLDPDKKPVIIPVALAAPPTTKIQ